MYGLLDLTQHIPFALTDWSGPLALVGGCIRDALIGRVRPTLDLDFVAPGPAVSQAKKLAGRLKAGFALLDAENEIARLVLPDGLTLDFARQQGDLETDLARRDFTINALAYDLHAQVLIDPLNGQTDLKARRLRAVSEANLRDDPLRVLRGYRLAAQLEFEIEPTTRALLVACAPLLAEVSAERVREELSALIAAPRGADWLPAAYRDGALTHWLPELTAMEAIGASGYHHLPLIEHTFEVVRQVDRVVARQPEVQADLARPVTGTRSIQTLVKWAALLHDIAKPATWKVDPETGKTSFTDHENQGALMSQAILQRLKFSRDEERWVVALVKHHLRPGGLAAHLPPSDRAVYRLCRDLGEMLPALLMLALADRYSTLGPQVKPADLERFDTLVGLLLGRYYAPDDRLAHPVPLLDGHGLMLALGLKPGPQIGKLLATLQESQALGEVGTREEAIALAQRLIESG